MTLSTTRRFPVICLLALVVYSICCGTAAAATLLLHDGTIVRGDIRSVKDDIYTVDTDSLGTLRVRKQDIRSIDLSDDAVVHTPAQSAPADAATSSADLQTMQMRMMQNPDLLSMVRGLQGDPQIQALLADPEVMNAVMSGDISALMNHPKIIALQNNQSVREIVEQVR